jgi:hypothetical protein
MPKKSPVSGFTKGTPLKSHKGWKGTWGTNFNAPGFNFAVDAHDEHSLEFWADHVPAQSSSALRA